MILVADVVGYSRLAGADEERRLARLRVLRSDLIDPSIALHHGRIHFERLAITVRQIEAYCCRSGRPRVRTRARRYSPPSSARDRSNSTPSAPTFCATSCVSPSTGQTIRSPHTRGRTNMVVVVSGSNTVTKAVLPLAATVAPSPRPLG